MLGITSLRSIKFLGPSVLTKKRVLGTLSNSASCSSYFFVKHVDKQLGSQTGLFESLFD